MSDGGCGLGGILGAPDSRFLKICGACGRPQYGSEPSVPASHPTAESAVSPRGACRRFQLASRGGRYTVLSRAVGATRSRTHRTGHARALAGGSSRPGCSENWIQTGLSCSRNASGVPSFKAAPPVLAHVQTIITTAHRNPVWPRAGRVTAGCARGGCACGKQPINGRRHGATTPPRAVADAARAHARGGAAAGARYGTVSQSCPSARAHASLLLRLSGTSAAATCQWRFGNGGSSQSLKVPFIRGIGCDCNS